jgi:GH24 family phage-related lysozyme (muramidase)
MIGPTKKPQDFGFKRGDSHIVVNDISETAKAYSFDGKLLWEVPALARGQGSDIEFRLVRTDTPPGIYKIGEIYKDYERVGPTPPYDRTLAAYGWYSFDMVELENQESKYGRSGIMLHGGGSNAGWPMAWAPNQPLFATHGCVRMRNIDLRDKVLPLTKTGTVYISVYQEANPAIQPSTTSVPKPPVSQQTPVPKPPVSQQQPPIKFTDAAKFYKEEPQQVDAWNFLQASIHKEILDEFSRRFRNEKVEPTLEGLPEPGIKLIKEFEGCHLKAYYDPLTNSLPITIGWGSTRRKDGTRFMIGNTITQDEADDLLYFQLRREFLPSLQKIPYWNEMSENQQGALLSFAYNLGANFYGSSGFNTISKNLREKDWKAIPKTLELYRNPGSSVEAGLLRRRIAEGKLWMEGL